MRRRLALMVGWLALVVIFSVGAYYGLYALQQLVCRTWEHAVALACLWKLAYVLFGVLVGLEPLLHSGKDGRWSLKTDRLLLLGIPLFVLATYDLLPIFRRLLHGVLPHDGDLFPIPSLMAVAWGYVLVTSFHRRGSREPVEPGLKAVKLPHSEPGREDES